MMLGAREICVSIALCSWHRVHSKMAMELQAPTSRQILR